jgi:hypothetical protein
MYFKTSRTVVLNSGDFAPKGHLVYVETFLVVTSRQKEECALGTLNGLKQGCCWIPPGHRTVPITDSHLDRDVDVTVPGSAEAPALEWCSESYWQRLNLGKGWGQYHPFYFLFVFVDTRGWTQGSHLLSKHPTTWATVPTPFALVIFEIGSCFIPRWAWTTNFLFVLPHIAGMTGSTKVPSHLLSWESHELFA